VVGLWFVGRIQTYTQCTRLHTASLVPQPQHLVLNTICSNIQPVILMMGILMPETCRDIYFNKPQLLHQVGTSRHFHRESSHEVAYMERMHPMFLPTFGDIPKFNCTELDGRTILRKSAAWGNQLPLQQRVHCTQREVLGLHNVSHA